MKKRTWVALLSLALVVALVFTVAAGCSSPSSKQPTIDKIKKRGVLKVGVKADVLGFGFMNPATKQYEGLEIDIAKRIAKDLLGDAKKVEFTAVTGKTRMGVLDNGEIDMVIATFTITEDRKKQVDFSPVYHVDGIQLLVKKDSGITGLKDTDKKTIGVAKGSDTQDRLQALAAKLNIKPQFASFETYPEILAALQSGRVQAFATDGSVLKYYESQDKTTVILPDKYSSEEYGVATKKGNDDLRDFVAKVINTMNSSGDLKQLKANWGLGK